MLANDFHRPAIEKVLQMVNYPLFNKASTKHSLSPYHCLAESVHCAVEQLLFSLSLKLLHPLLPHLLLLSSPPLLIPNKLFLTTSTIISNKFLPSGVLKYYPKTTNGLPTSEKIMRRLLAMECLNSILLMSEKWIPWRGAWKCLVLL